MPLGPIQTRPLSLGALLTLKTRGDMPRELLDEVRGTVDLESWWLRAKRQRWTTVPSRSPGSSYNGSFFSWLTGAPVVPQNEWWYVEHCSINVLVGPSDVLSGLAVGFFEPPLLPFRWQVVGPPQSAENLLAGNVWGLCLQAHGFWMPPGSTLGVYCGYASASAQFDLQGFDYVPLSLNDG